MPQPRITLQPEKMYHIWTHANGNENLFRSSENYHFFLEKYSQYIYPVADTFAYCLMPNHFHFMVRVRGENEILKFLHLKKTVIEGFEISGGFSKQISMQFSHLFNCYTQAYNKKYHRKGSLFMSNFNRKNIGTDSYFTALIAYIHNNPIHHGFVKDLNDWPYSSWHAYILNKNTRINKDVSLKWFGGKEEFFKIHNGFNPEKLFFLFE